MPSASSSTNHTTKLQQQHQLEKQGSASNLDDVIVLNNEIMLTAKKNIIDAFPTIVDENLDSVNCSEDIAISIQSSQNDQNLPNNNYNTIDLLNSNKSSIKSTNSGGNGGGGCSEPNNTLYKQIMLTIEHKIRNLEKRKTKLESYREIQNSGKDLSNDQKLAVAKYDAVAATLEFARTLSKQFMQFSKDAEKEQKKLARKELIVKAQMETAKVREVLVLQQLKSRFNDELVRQDFSNGENGAVKLETHEFEVLDKFFADVNLRTDESDNSSFMQNAQKAAELYSITIDGRPKPYHKQVTYEQLKDVMQKIQNCGYLERQMKRPVAVETSDNEKETENKIEVEDIVEQEPQPQQQLQQQVHEQEQHHQHPFMRQVHLAQQQQAPQAPPATALPVFQAANISGTASPVFNASHFPAGVPHLSQTVGMPLPTMHVAQQQQQLPNHFAGAAGGSLFKIEQAYIRHQQYMQQIRPLAEVIGSGNFFFLQESELDTPEMDIVAPNNNSQQFEPIKQQQPPQQQQQVVMENFNEEKKQLIATQTFTNQSFPTTVAAPSVATTTISVSPTNEGNLYEKLAREQKQQLLGRPIKSPALNNDTTIIATVAVVAATTTDTQNATAKAVNSQHSAVFPFDSPALYCQHHPNQGNTPSKTPSPVPDLKKEKPVVSSTKTTHSVNAWDTSPINSGLNLTSGFSKVHSLGETVLPTLNRNKWSNASDIDCTLVSARKHDWSSSTETSSANNNSTNYVDTLESNPHWNGVATTASDTNTFNRSGGGGGNPIGRSGSHHKRQNATSSTTGNPTYARGRNNFNSNALAHNGNNSSTAGSGGNTGDNNRTGSGIFFRNNDNVNNIFQNGNTGNNNNLYHIKESRYVNSGSGGNEFRLNPRNSNARNNNSNTRALLRGSGSIQGQGSSGANAGGGNNSSGTSGVTSYITPNRQSYRLP